MRFRKPLQQGEKNCRIPRLGMQIGENDEHEATKRLNEETSARVEDTNRQ